MMPLTPREGQRPPTEKAEALALSIARDVERSETERKERKERHRLSRSAIGVTILVLAAWVWLFPPSWLVPDGPSVASSGARGVEELQLALYLQAQVLAGYPAATGRLPRELSDGGVVVPGLRYIRTSSEAFILAGLADNAEMSFHSGERTPTVLDAGGTPLLAFVAGHGGEGGDFSDPAQGPQVPGDTPGRGHP